MLSIELDLKDKLFSLSIIIPKIPINYYILGLIAL